MSDIDPFDPAGTPLDPPRREPLRSNPNLVVETFPAEPIPQSKSGVIQWSWAGLAMTAVGFALSATKLSQDQQKSILSAVETLLPYVGIAAGFLATWYHRRKSTRAIQGGAGDPQVMAMKLVGERLRGGK